MSFKQDAEETKEWDRFWGSGKVEDYLRYKSCHREEDAEAEEKTEDATYCGKNNRKFLDERDRFS